MPLLLLALLFFGSGQAPDRQRTVESARELALRYSSTLPDFICTETVNRTDNSGGGQNTLNDRLTIELTYNGQKEHYKLLAINGGKTDRRLDSLAGIISGGEFGTMLLRVFDPSSKADFEWKKSLTVRQRAVDVYSFRVTRANSHYEVGYRDNSGAVVKGTAGYHGEVYLDSQTLGVMRITNVADNIPKESGIIDATMEVDYDSIEIAGQKYLLPIRAENRMTRGYRNIGSVVTFAGYHKFAAESTIDFSRPVP